jgi:hypothetical protein
VFVKASFGAISMFEDPRRWLVNFSTANKACLCLESTAPFRSVVAHVLGNRQNEQILNSVVCFIVVFVVHNLGFFELSSEIAAHNVTVFVNAGAVV